MGVFEGIVMMAVIFLVALVFWVWALVDILKSDFKDSINKIVWLAVIIFLPLLGSVLYYFIGRSQKIVHDE